MAIQSFSDDETEEFFVHGLTGKGVAWRNIANVARRKLDVLHYAAELQDLRSPPGNRLEALKGDRSRFRSIRINDQWRIVFFWTQNGPAQVRIVDYHP